MNTNNNSQLINNMNIDPIDMMEKLLGKDSLNDEEVMLSLGFSMMKNQEQERLLTEAKDIYFMISWESMKNVLRSNGFKFAYSNFFNHEEHVEEEVVAYRKDGLVLYANSYSGDNLNAGTVYFEATPKEGFDIKDVYHKIGVIHAGGGMSKDKTYCEFNFDIRNGLMWRIAEVCKIADLVPVWKEAGKFLWFVNYKEKDIEGYDYEKINNDKIKTFPSEAKDIIGNRLVTGDI